MRYDWIYVTPKDGSSPSGWDATCEECTTGNLFFSHPTTSMCMLFIRVLCWPKIWVLMVPSLIAYLCYINPRYKKVTISYQCFSLSQLRKRDQCAGFFSKLGVCSDADLLTHVSPPKDVRDILKNDAMKIFFLRE
jgi:hypothetical protein